MRKNRITESDIRRLVKKVINESNDEVEEGWDSHSLKSKYDDFNPSKFRKLPKDAIKPGMTDMEGTTLTRDDEEYDEYDDLDTYRSEYEDDFNIDDYLNGDDFEDWDDDEEYA